MSEIGRRKRELDWLKKVRDQPLRERQGWIDREEPLAPSRPCALAGISRSVLYAPRRERGPSAQDLELLALIDAEYTRHPFHGRRRKVRHLRGLGHLVDRKRVQRLMRTLGLAGMAPGPNTRQSHPRHPVYPHRLRGVEIDSPDPVRSADIAYVRLPLGFVYRVAVIDGSSRAVPA